MIIIVFEKKSRKWEKKKNLWKMFLLIDEFGVICIFEVVLMIVMLSKFRINEVKLVVCCLVVLIDGIWESLMYGIYGNSF